MWGLGAVVSFDEGGNCKYRAEIGVPNVSCPLINGHRLFVTSASDEMSADELDKFPNLARHFC